MPILDAVLPEVAEYADDDFDDEPAVFQPSESASPEPPRLPPRNDNQRIVAFVRRTTWTDLIGGGLIVMLVAAIVAIVGILSNAGPNHLLSDSFSVFGYHVTGSTGTLFLFGIAIGAVAAIGLGLLLTGARRTSTRAHDVQRDARRFRRETAFINRERDARLDHQPPLHEGTELPETENHTMLGALRAKLR